MAGGMLTKQADQLTAKFLNDVNDATSGGAVVSAPVGVPSAAISATQPGDRIVLDDAAALANSDTVVGTLYGGVYMYVGTLSTATATYIRGRIAFWRSNEMPNGATAGYTCTADAQPTTATPTYIAGVVLNTLTAGNYGWIQVAGTASILFDNTLTATGTGLWVSAKVSASAGTLSSADCGAAIGTTTLSALLGTALGSPTASTVSAVILWRGAFCGRI